jgi:hypothetical protein
MRVAAILLVLFVAVRSAAAADQSATAEINYLIDYVEKSQARFFRNGSEYSAKEGAEHLRKKLANAGGRVKTAADFIKGIATKSYFSGKPYMVKTADGKLRPTGPWLDDALARHRASSP